MQIRSNDDFTFDGLKQCVNPKKFSTFQCYTQNKIRYGVNSLKIALDFKIYFNFCRNNYFSFWL